MKTYTKSLLFAILCCLLFVAQILSADELPANSESSGTIKKFLKGKVTCYCTPERSGGLDLNSKALKKALKQSEQGLAVFGCGQKNLMLLKVPSNAMDGDMADSCYAGVESDLDGNYACWTKKNYIEYDLDEACESLGFAGDPNEDDRPLCKDLGSIVGAGSCKKDN